MITLYEHQRAAIEKLQSGNILVGGVGSGKSLTALTYFVTKECGGKIKTNGKGGFSKMRSPKDLYIITTARKRDTMDWEQECKNLLIPVGPKTGPNAINVVVDSWNKLSKYENVRDAFFIFDEQRLIGHGSWVRSFLRIAKFNKWILLSATPGDTWIDYIPVFIANGFYQNRSHFITKHVVYKRWMRYPVVDFYRDTEALEALRTRISVIMTYEKPTISHHETIIVPFDKEYFREILVSRWNPDKECPITNISELCYKLREVCNTDPGRVKVVKNLITEHSKCIIFYNFVYERNILKDLADKMHIACGEWNGQSHQPIPSTESWIYLVQYNCGEGWNCVETNVMIFYSQNYSYRMMTQAAGRIDRLNTKYSDLWYYTLRSDSTIDLAIAKAIRTKREFNETRFMDY